MAFRIGRRFASHTYPTPTHGGPGPSSFARNYANGPTSGGDVAIVTSRPETPVFTPTHSSAEAGTITADGVPITPAVTGRILITAVVNVLSVAEGPTSVSVFPQVDGVTSTDPIAVMTVPTGGSVAVPVEFEIPAELSGLSHVNLVLLAGGSGLLLTSVSGAKAFSTMELQEIPVATG